MTKRNIMTSVVVAFILLMNSSCIKDVKDALDETAESLRCVERVNEFDDKNDANPDRSCSEIVADLDDIERTCNEFLSDSVKEQFQELRDACANEG